MSDLKTPGRFRVIEVASIGSWHGKLEGVKVRVIRAEQAKGLSPGFYTIRFKFLDRLEETREFTAYGVRLKRLPKKGPVCKCEAYKFPHAAGRGKCTCDEIFDRIFMHRAECLSCKHREHWRQTEDEPASNECLAWMAGAEYWLAECPALDQEKEG